MNFQHMPELGWRLGYPLVLVVMAGVCLGWTGRSGAAAGVQSGQGR
jgi:Mg2+ and Co2+ transporter CorA